MAALDAVLAQALELSETERRQLVERLLLSLPSPDEEEISQVEWEDAWSKEIDRRIRDIDEGRAELVDGEEALRFMRERIAARRR